MNLTTPGRAPADRRDGRLFVQPAAGGGATTLAAVLMIAAGILAILLPLAAGVGIALFAAAMLLAGGVLHLAYALSSRGAGHRAMNLLVGLLYAVAGIWLLLMPLLSLVSLTLLLAAILLAEGILQLVAYLQLRRLRAAGWLLFDGIVTVLLAVLILLGWPATSLWAIGSLFGINLIVSGVARLLHRPLLQGSFAIHPGAPR